VNTIRAAVNNGAAIPVDAKEKYYWDTTMLYIDKRNSYCRKKVKLGKGENQLVHQAKHFEQSTAMHRIPTMAGITDTVLE
jgi:hypothetical protein